MHPKRRIRALVHGDDFIMAGRKPDLDWFKSEIQALVDVKHKARLGDERRDDEAVRILNRILTWIKDDIQHEADQRHAEMMVYGWNQPSPWRFRA